jgi:hypothetical protein
MFSICVDMFEVQLGAAVLLQFNLEDKMVRVLADAGVSASGYQADHVLKKVRQKLGFDARIDLVIGTHYDEDHLNGLVPIINDRSIEIGEAWMPPVANDTQSFAVDQPLDRSALLPHQFAGEEGGEVLSAYLAAKRADIETIDVLEAEIAPKRSSELEQPLPEGRMTSVGEDPHDTAFFREQLASATHDDHAINHGVEQEVEPDPLVTRMIEDVERGRDPFWFRHYGPTVPLNSLKSYASELRTETPESVPARARSLAHLRKSAAKDAINATALYDVVQALRRRNIPIRSEVIEDGTPRRYRWTQATRRFVAARPDSDGLCFTLLGPSRSLVQKHRDRLPVLGASKIALAFWREIRSITPSNQLSYIGCFNYDDQAILISGDAGCVDFKLDRNNYHPKLLAAMKPLHVVQVAHHGGNNAHFYRVLAAAGYPEQEEPSYLLLSHATDDKTRPSDVFRDFVLTALHAHKNAQLLFTSKPKYDKVEDYLSAIHPRVGPCKSEGDIQLQYDKGWQVTAHAIEVP